MPGHLVRRSQQIHNSIWVDVIGREITSVQFAVLHTLAEAGLNAGSTAGLDDGGEPVGLDQRTVADRIGSDRSTIADLADRLNRQGLVRQDRDPEDGRRRVLVLTNAGAEAHARLVPLVDEVQHRLLAGFSPADRQLLLNLLHRLVDQG